MKKLFIVVPTWNESENIELLVETLRNLVIPYDVNILIVDDNSPDKTWERGEQLSDKYDNVFCMRRLINKGRGLAGVAGFNFALQNGADLILEMDADFSHNPCFIPKLLEATEKYDLVLGSRRAVGGAELNRPFYRTVITFFANLYIRILLRVPVKDCNSGFRVFNSKIFNKVDLNKVRAKGPDIVQELLFKVHRAGFSIGEVGVIFKERERGNSSLTFKKVLNGYIAVLRLRWIAWRGKI